MNYKKYIKKKERLVNELEESFRNNVNYLELKFEIRDVKFTTIYKDDNIIFITYESESFRLFHLSIYIYIDYLSLDISKTMFDYSLYKK